MNPFISKEFTSTWLKYFASHKTPSFFKSITPLGFVKGKLPFLYYNIGRNITNGMGYVVNPDQKDYRGKVFLVFDVIRNPSEVLKNKPQKMGLKTVKQYKGYCTNFSKYGSYDDFMMDHYSSSSRRVIRRNDQKLNTNFIIEERVVFGSISRNEYDILLDRIFYLIETRFRSLGLENDIIEKKDYYRELFYDMILQRKAVVHMLCHNDLPIAASLSFISDKIVYYAITTFDIKYRRYNLGHLIIASVAKWCFENGFETLDYSKGTYEYKLRWSNESYFFENHLLYDKDFRVLRCRRGCYFQIFPVQTIPEG